MAQAMADFALPLQSERRGGWLARFKSSGSRGNGIPDPGTGTMADRNANGELRNPGNEAVDRSATKRSRIGRLS
jgi:hypothetical protein